MIKEALITDYKSLAKGIKETARFSFEGWPVETQVGFGVEEAKSYNTDVESVKYVRSYHNSGNYTGMVRDFPALK